MGDDVTTTWTGHNNAGICATALLAVLEHSRRLSLPRALLVMPLVMHEATLALLSRAGVRKREAIAIASLRPDLLANFPRRFEDSLVVSVNAIQLLTSLGYIEFDSDLVLLHSLPVDANFGARALRIHKAAENVAALLASPEEELYLNFRVRL